MGLYTSIVIILQHSTITRVTYFCTEIALKLFTENTLAIKLFVYDSNKKMMTVSKWVSLMKNKSKFPTVTLMGV